MRQQYLKCVIPKNDRCCSKFFTFCNGSVIFDTRLIYQNMICFYWLYGFSFLSINANMNYKQKNSLDNMRSTKFFYRKISFGKIVIFLSQPCFNKRIKTSVSQNLLDKMTLLPDAIIRQFFGMICTFWLVISRC